MELFPEEVWHLILRNLDTLALLQTIAVCSRWEKSVYSSVTSFGGGMLRKYPVLNSNYLLRFPFLAEITINRDASITAGEFQRLQNLKSLCLADKTYNLHDEALLGLTNLRRLEFFVNVSPFEKSARSAPVLFNKNRAKPFVISDFGLSYVADSLRSLILVRTSSITDAGVKLLTNLTELVLGRCAVTHESVSCLVNLTSLDLSENDTVYDEGIAGLYNLQSLVLNSNPIITDFGVHCLVNLIQLSLVRNRVITDNGIKGLELVSLDISDYSSITGSGIEEMVSLEELFLNANGDILNYGIRKLVNLTSLDLGRNPCITDEALQNLTNLEYLVLAENKCITDNGLSVLVKLRDLDLYCNASITNASVSLLTNLTRLDIFNNKTITFEGISHLTQLEELTLFNNALSEAELKTFSKATVTRFDK